MPLLLSSIALLGADGGDIRVGSKLETIAVHDPDGKPKTLKLTEGKGTAIIFVASPNCPAGEAHTPHVTRLQSDYEGKGIRFVILNPKPNGAAARLLDAKLTPEMFLFDEAGTLVYRGRVDSAPSDNPITKRDARAAIDAVLAKESVQEPEVPVRTGCPIAN